MESDRDDGEPSDHGKSREKTLFPATSLFPIANAESGADNKPQWLCNPSFSVDVSKIAGSGEGAAFDVWQERDEERPSDTQKRPSYELLETSSSYSSDSRDKGRRRRKKKKKKRKTGNSHDLAEETSRKSSARAWVSSRRKPEKDYYFHVRGDRDNLAFGSLYKMDVARFKRHDLDPSDLDILRSKSFIKGNIVLELEGDVNSMGNKAKSEGRYYSVKYSTLERHKQLKRICFLHAERSYIIAEEFIPLSNLSSLENDSITELQPDLENEESLEDQIIRKTKEFNKTTRDFPHDEKAWLAFADYQDQLVSMQSTKAARLQALDKKISVLEKAVELNTDNEELLLYLMKAYKSKDSTSILERWERILAQHPGSSKLWKEFLRDCQSEFSRFRTSDMRKMYSHALQALSSTSKKLCTQAHQFGKLPKDVPEILQIEQGLVDIFVNLCRFEWQTGHQELATGLFQAEIDYSLFSPSLLLSEQNKLRLFEHFWNDDGARLGEDEAIGWGEWIEKEEENRQKAKLLEESILESEPGGWTGWTEVKLKGSDVGQVSPHLLESMSDEDDDSGEHESNDTAQDLPALLAKLGIDVNTEADADITDTSVWKKWAEEEAMRDSEQWLPLHRKAEKDGEEQLSRVITFEDVGEYLFSLCSDDARFSLVSQFVDFFDGPIARWTFTNSPSWSEKLRNSENFSRSMLKDIEDAQELNQNNSSFNTFNMDHIFSSSTNVNTRVSILKFLQNAILLLMKVFPRNLILEETVLRSDILFETTRSSLVNELTPCRGLAKSLLKKDRQDLILCGVYARCEAAFGCIGVARKVFDMALSSVEGLSSELQVNGSLLYLWYAEMEVSNQTITGSRDRAIYILSCLGSGAKYSTSICEISSTLLLRARQGFKEKIRASRSYWARGEIKDQAIALVCSAALFEELTSGWASAKGIFDDAFSMVLPGRRSQSCQLESLFLYYIMMLKRNMKQATLSRSWETILLGLDLYPYNSKIFSAIIEVGSTYTVPYNIRRLFDDCCQKKPSILVWIFSLLSELKKEGLQNRVHGLFERALASDEMQKSVMLWRCYLAYELHLDNPASAKRIFFRAIHACPWSKKLWLDGFQKLNSFLTAKELSDLQEVMRDKELNLRTDIYEILLQDETS